VNDQAHALVGGVARRSLTLLWRGMRTHPGVYVLAVLSSGMFGALTVALSQFLAHITNTVVVLAIQGDDAAQARIWTAGLGLAGLALALAVSVAGRRIFAGMGSTAIGADHRRGVTRQYLRLPMSWHRAHPTGQLLANASSDVEAATGVFNPLPFALGVVVMTVVAAVALFRTDAVLAVTALTILPIVAGVNLVFQRKMAPVATRAQQLRAEVADVAHESFEAALLVSSLGTAEVEERRFAGAADRLRAANVGLGRIRAVFDPVVELPPSVGTLAVLVVGAVRLSSGAVDTGDIVGAAFLLTLIAIPVRAFGWVLGELPRARVGYDRIARVLDARADQEVGTQPLLEGSGGLHVQLRGASVQIRDPGPAGATHTLLHAVNLDLAPGRVVAVVGPTGSGKSTLASLLARLHDPASG
jgi:ATP-binding cassette, subfamily B, bacterial